MQRTYPLSNLGGAFLGRAKLPWMGQTPEVPQQVVFPTVSYVDPENRTLSQRLIHLLKRRGLAVPSVGKRDFYGNPLSTEIYRIGWPGKIDAADQTINIVNQGAVTAEEAISQVSDWPLEAASGIYRISQDPRRKEINDLDEIDSFFGPLAESPLANQDPFYTQPCQDGFFYPTVVYGELVNYRNLKRDPNQPYWQHGFGDAIPLDEPFWCSPFAKNPASEILGLIVSNEVRFPQFPAVSHEVKMRYQGDSGSARATFWGISTDTLWSDVKAYMPNLRLADKVLKDYPLPSPFNEYTRQFTEFCLPGLRELVKVPVELTEEEIRVWITFSILGHYNDMVGSLNSQLKDKARNKRRDALAATIAGIVIGSLVLAAALPSIIANILGSAIGAMNKINAHDLQVKMGEIADAFKDTDPAFAGEVGNAAGYVNRLSSALESAIDKEQVGRIVGSSGMSTGLVIGGIATGLAAIALAIFRK